MMCRRSCEIYIESRSKKSRDPDLIRTWSLRDARTSHITWCHELASVPRDGASGRSNFYIAYIATLTTPCTVARQRNSSQASRNFEEEFRPLRNRWREHLQNRQRLILLLVRSWLILNLLRNNIIRIDPSRATCYGQCSWVAQRRTQRWWRYRSARCSTW